MPLYLVRWPGFVAAIVNAADEDSLIDILDETANPEGCTWSVYRGPLYVEFALNAELKIDDGDEIRERPLDPSQITIGDVSRICERDVMEAVLDMNSDTAATMVDRILEKAFPALYPVVRTLGDDLPEDKVRAALQTEAQALVRATWQHQQTKRRPDRDSRVAAMMGTSARLVARWSKAAAAAQDRAVPSKKPTATQPPTKPTKPTKPKGNGPRTKPRR